MSYSIVLNIKAGDVTVEHTSGGEHNLPDGKLTINGHHVVNGAVGIETIGISLAASDDSYAGASSNASVGR
jgi:hypothetical protein